MADGVLIIDDETSLARSAASHLSYSGYDVRVATTAGEGIAQLDTFRPDVVVLDSRLPDRNGVEVVSELQSRDAQLPIIMLTGPTSVDLAVEAVRRGAHDFLTKPVPGAALAQAVSRVLGDRRRRQALCHVQARRSSNANGAANAHGNEIAGLVGEAPAMVALRSHVKQLVESERAAPAAARPSILVVGEPGTGKALLARAIHFDGPRGTGPFVEVDCAAQTPQQLDATLFGYERGAIAGAWTRRLGLTEAAHGGTLFLREVGALTLELQAKLLRLMEERRSRRAGGVRDHVVDVRIIATAGPGLDAAVRSGRFRPELHFRLRGIELHMPPLRERSGDIVPLGRWFLALHGARYGKAGLAFAPEMEAALVAHRWPGNVVELRNAVEQAVLNTQDRVIRRDCFAFCGVGAAPAEGVQPVSDAAAELNLARRERELLVRALEETRWNVSRAARLLGVTRDTLRYRIDKYGLTRP